MDEITTKGRITALLGRQQMTTGERLCSALDCRLEEILVWNHGDQDDESV
jgi:hypothetical protein